MCRGPAQGGCDKCTRGDCPYDPSAKKKEKVKKKGKGSK